jgi:hypothetical protein
LVDLLLAVSSRDAAINPPVVIFGASQVVAQHIEHHDELRENEDFSTVLLEEPREELVHELQFAARAHEPFSFILTA